MPRGSADLGRLQAPATETQPLDISPIQRGITETEKIESDLGMTLAEQLFDFMFEVRATLTPASSCDCGSGTMAGN
jgi:hypothetical protein